MASFTMATSFAGSTATVAGRPSATRNLVVAKAAKVERKEVVADKPTIVEETETRECKGRRGAMFAVATVAISAIAGVPAFAEEEPKKGTDEAKKKYAQICVTMPTASICRK